MLIPVILSGGAGTRLWPVSREGHPKPFMRLADGQTLIGKTYARAARLADPGTILTVTNLDYYFLSKDEFTSAKLGDARRASYLLEPAGRNTAPAIALAACAIAEEFGRDAMMLVLAADHLIQDQAAFDAAVAAATRLAAQGLLTTFGIVPTAPETGFGYIEAGAAIGGADDGRKVVRFVEKPDLARAREFVAAGNFLWNSGMFCFKAGVVLDQIKQHAPDVYKASLACWAAMGPGGANAARGPADAMREIPAEAFGQVPNISIDYAVMERSDRVAVVPGDFGWSDIGSWDAVAKLAAPDANNNRAVGHAIFVDSANTYVQSDERLVAAVGVSDLLVIDTPDALLIADPAKSQEVKQVVAKLKADGHEAYKLHRTVARPWGTYTILGEGAAYKIKRIEVKPGASLSLQMHHHRSEHWIVVRGMARVVNGEQEIFVKTNESTYIPAGHKHRLENPGVLDLVMIEVQSGEYLGEDDIVRYQDVYGRV
ncbi:MAG: mannose-1-phosphate guanylyltransferase/mannose-6-phosphate isomerase [Lautropia sp.]